MFLREDPADVSAKLCILLFQGLPSLSPAAQYTEVTFSECPSPVWLPEPRTPPEGALFAFPAVTGKQDRCHAPVQTTRLPKHRAGLLRGLGGRSLSDLEGP